jgi:hypothetical protein
MSELGTNTTNVLNRVATVLAELHPLDEALRQVVSITCEQLLCSEAGIWLLDKEQDSLCLSVAVPKTAKLRTSLSPSGQGMLNKVANGD